MSLNYTNLLRRTLALLGAALALATGSTAFAQGTVTLSGATGNSCNYSQMTVTPNGNITVACGTTNPQIATFSLSHASSASNYVLAPNTSSSATVARAGGPAEALMVMFSVTGSGCSSNSGGIMLLAGQSQTIPFSVGAAATTCTVTIGAPAGGHLANPNTLTFTAQTSTTPPPTGGGDPGPVAGCPAPLNTSINGATRPDGDKGVVIDISNFQGVTNTYGLSSGTIIYWPVPTPTTSVKAGFSQGQTARTPVDPVISYQVSKCPGVFLDSSQIASQCNYSARMTGNQSELTIWTAAAADSTGKVIGSQSDLVNPTICFAPIATATYYINVKTTYSSCPYEGSGGCGFSYRWNQFGSNSQF